jgi:hypothetical protein
VIKELKDVQDVRVFAYDGTHYASSTLGIEDLQYVVGLESRGYIYTDRPAYRPGQQVNMKGIIREVDEQGVLRVPKVSPSPSPSLQGFLLYTNILILLPLSLQNSHFRF